MNTVEVAQPSHKDEQFYHNEAHYDKPQLEHAPAPYETYSPEVYEFTKVVKSNTDNGTIELYSEGTAVPMENEDLTSEYNQWANALLEAKKAAENVTNNSSELYQVLHNYNYGYKEVSYAQKFNLPNITSGHHHEKYYLGGDKYARETCESLNIDLDFNAVIPLMTGTCQPQSCILSQYAACIENPRDEHKNFKKPVHYNYYTAPLLPATYGRSLLSSPQDSILSYASVGFIVGVVVVALIQFVLSKRSTPTNMNMIL